MDRSIPRFLQARTAALGDALPNSCLAALWDSLACSSAAALWDAAPAGEGAAVSVPLFLLSVSKQYPWRGARRSEKKLLYFNFKNLVRTGLLCAQEFNDNISLHGMTMSEPRSVSTSPSLGDSLAFQIPVGSLRKKPRPIPWLRTRTDAVNYITRPR